VQYCRLAAAGRSDRQTDTHTHTHTDRHTDARDHNTFLVVYDSRKMKWFSISQTNTCLQCVDIVGLASGRASSLQKIEWANEVWLSD